MPLYEYRCKACNTKNTFFTKSISSPLEPVCPSCGSKDMTRLFSTFAQHKTLKDIHESFGPVPEHASQAFYRDPRNIGRSLEESYERLGTEVPEKIRQEIDAAREGYVPPDVEI